MKQLSRVLAAVDFSKPARDAFEYALALSHRRGAELAVVHIVPARRPFSSRARARVALMAKLRHRADQAGVAFTERIQHGDPAEMILLHAESVRADIIVMGTHQRSGFDRLRAGSVGERVLTGATVPVLLVPHLDSAVEPFRHVAVAVDFSEGSRRAIEQGAALATGASSRLTLLHVVPGFSGGAPAHLYRYGMARHQDELIRDARRRLHDSAPADGDTPAHIDRRVLVGDTKSEITRVVDNIGADLLVMGVPKRGAVSRALFGTTAARLLKAIRIPMLAVPTGRMATVRDVSNDALAVAA